MYMSNSFLEIVELPNGDIALQRGDGELLVRIHFSETIKDYLQENHVDVAKAMITTGIQTVGRVTEEEKTEQEAAVTVH